MMDALYQLWLGYWVVYCWVYGLVVPAGAIGWWLVDKLRGAA